MVCNRLRRWVGSPASWRQHGCVRTCLHKASWSWPGWVISLLLCMNELRKQSSYLKVLIVLWMLGLAVKSPRLELGRPVSLALSIYGPINNNPLTLYI